MNDKDLKLIECSLYVCSSSKEDPSFVKYILEWIDEKIKVVKINAKTKENKEQIIHFSNIDNFIKEVEL